MLEPRKEVPVDMLPTYLFSTLLDSAKRRFFVLYKFFHGPMSNEIKVIKALVCYGDHCNEMSAVFRTIVGNQDDIDKVLKHNPFLMSKISLLMLAQAFETVELLSVIPSMILHSDKYF